MLQELWYTEELPELFPGEVNYQQQRRDQKLKEGFEVLYACMYEESHDEA